MKPIISLILILQTVFVYSQAPDSLTQSLDSSAINNQQNENYTWRTLVDKDYSIQYPMNWIVDNSGQLGAELFLFSPEESKEDQFIESINLVITDLTAQKASLSEYIQKSEEELASMITNFKLLENKQVQNQNGECQEMLYTGDHNQYKLQFKKFYWIRNNKAFVLTFTGEQANFEDYSKMTDKILNSFLIKE